MDLPPDVAPVALVTGASGALGAAVARCLGTRGLAVGLHAHSHPERLDGLVADLPSAHPVVADVADAVAVQAAADEVAQVLGPIGVVVTCAGVRVDGLLHAQSTEAWDRTIAVNLLGTHHAVRAVLPGMLKARGGRVIVVTSPSALQGRAGQTAYGASKAGVIGLVRSLAREVGRRSVTVNAISPGFVESEMNESLSVDAVEALRARIDLDRFATPDDIVRAVEFLLDSPYVTGQVLGVDGGMNL